MSLSYKNRIKYESSLEIKQKKCYTEAKKNEF